MKQVKRFSPLALSALLALAMVETQGCSKSKQPETGPQPAQTSSTPTPSTPSQTQAQVQLPDLALSADGLDELLSPIALYPDPVLAVMLQAAQDPQEVMDGGNWLALDQNQNLKEAALDQASSKAGFTPVMQALLHYGPVVDLMCTQFDWTKQLGAAYKADPKAVLASVQRLRAQAVDNGALKSSPQLKVDLKQDQGSQVVEISSPDPGSVYIPQYDPTQVYAVTPATSTEFAPAAANQTVIVQQQDPGVSKGTATLIGLLSFGAGIAVGSAIHHDDYYYPNWGYGGVYYGGRPYYPPPYRPVYGGGWGGGYNYNRPVHYGNNNVYINNSHNNYYNRFNGNNNTRPGYRPQPVHYNNRPGSITSNSLGNRQDAHRGVTANNRASHQNNNFRGQTTYQGGNRAGAPAQQNRLAAGGGNLQGPSGGGNNVRGQNTYQGANRGNNAPQQNRLANGNAASNMQRPAGGSGNQASRPVSLKANAANREGAGAGNRGGDRGYGQAGARPSTGNSMAGRQGSGQAASRPQPASRPPSSPSGAFGGASNPKSDRAASSRGRQSMGAPANAPGGAQNRNQSGRKRQS